MNRTAVLALVTAVLIAALMLDGLPFGEFALYVAGIVMVLLLIIGLARLLRWLFAGNSRPCPRCGNSVANGVLECSRCGFDFRVVGDPPRIRATLPGNESAPAVP